MRLDPPAGGQGKHQEAAPASTMGPVGAGAPAAGSRVTANVLTSAISAMVSDPPASPRGR